MTSYNIIFYGMQKLYVPWRPRRDGRPDRRPAATRARCSTACRGTCRRRTGGRRPHRPRPPWPVRRPARRATGRSRRNRRAHRKGRRDHRGTSRRSASASRWCATRSTGTRRPAPRPSPAAVPTPRPRSSYCRRDNRCAFPTYIILLLLQGQTVLCVNIQYLYCE